MTISSPSPPVFLFAPGAGAPSSHPWMQRWKALLETLGRVELFDYDYMREGRKRPDSLPQLLAAHRRALQDARGGAERTVLVGKSMGGRIGCHLSLVEGVDALICLGYPLCGGGDRSRLRDVVLRDLRTPILFVQGTRDPLCPLDLLEEIRPEMRAANYLHVVDGGDHSLELTKTRLKEAQQSQADVDACIVTVISDFLGIAIQC